MRATLVLVSLLAAAFSIALDLCPTTPDFILSHYRWCRFDQIYAGIDAVGITPASMSVLVLADPANPMVWCTYADLLNAGGERGKAAAAFEYAVSLGPGMSPVLMRTANFDFTHERRDHGILMASQILSQTGVFDEILFSYVLQPGVPVSTLLSTAIPAIPRAAQSWLEWLRTHGSDQDLLGTWSWMREHQLFGPTSANDLAWTLWQRKEYQNSQLLWADWLGSARGDYLRPQRLTNRRFENAPNLSPFDWILTPPPSAELSRKDGLQIRFAGTENIAFSEIRQFTTARPGNYRFSAEVKSEGLTTDQRPFFHIFDPVHPNAVDATSEPFKQTVPRSWITMQFTVPAGTQVLQVQLERRPSQRFDNRIAGTVHVYEVSLVPDN